MSLQELPGTIQQFQNAKEAHRTLKNVPERGLIMNATLMGLMTLAPEAVERSKVLEEPQRIKVAENFVRYDMRFNDRIDFENSGRRDIDHIIADSLRRENEAKGKLETELQSMPDKTESAELQRIINDFYRETTAVETYAHARGDQFTMQDAIAYRRVVNAIPKSVSLRVLLGKDGYPHPLPSLPDSQLSWEQISNKYAWLFKPKQDTDTSLDRTLKIMERVTTIAQIDDDWYGRHIDERLSIPSIAKGALTEFAHDPDPNNRLFNEMAAKAELDIERARYLREARELGLGFIPLNTIVEISRQAQAYNQLVTTAARNHSAILKISKVQRSYADFPRETAYMKGEL